MLCACFRQISAAGRTLEVEADPAAVQRVGDEDLVDPEWSRSVDLVPADGRAAPAAQPPARRRVRAHDAAEERVAAALAAGGRLVDDSHPRRRRGQRG